MPTRHLGPTPVVEFDPQVEISPFALFRRLRDGRGAPVLIDVRPAPAGHTLAGATAWPGADWEPAADSDTVLFDEDGQRAVELARQLQARGCARVRALFGGLDLYRFALDPEIVGAETFLRTLP
jgi:rhodanese-related sulfurtransferase